MGGQPVRGDMLSCERLAACLRLADPVQSPDGRRIAFSAAAGFSTQGGGPERRIWLVETDGNAAPLTDSVAAATLPRWSPDGSTLAFASSEGHPERTTLRLLESEERDVRPLGDIPGSVQDIRWSDDGGTLLVLAADASTAADKDPRVRRTSDPVEPWRRLYRVELATGATREVGTEGFTVWEFDWDGDDVIAVLANDPTENGWYRAFVGRLDLATGSATPLYAPRWQIACPTLSPGTGRVAFLEGICSDRGSLVGTVMVIDPGADKPRAIAPELDAMWIGWREQSALWFTARHGLEAACGVLTVDGAVEPLWRGEGAFRGVPSSVRRSRAAAARRDQGNALRPAGGCRARDRAARGGMAPAHDAQHRARRARVADGRAHLLGCSGRFGDRGVAGPALRCR